MVIKKGIKKRNDFTTTEISTLRRERRKSERKYRKSKSEDDRKLFKDLVSSVSKAVKTSRNVFYTNKLCRCKDGKETFQVVNKLLDKGTMKGILPAHLDEDKLCSEFEKYFHEKIEKIRISIEAEIFNSSKGDANTIDEYIYTGNELREFSILTADDLKNILKEMSMKFCDLDPIPTWLFISCEHVIVPYLMPIINGALETGNFLKALKVALVKPSLKKETLDSDLLGNYRPVSNIAFMSKILEKCILLQLTEHLNKNNLWGKYQSAYRKFHSCETAVTKIMDDILNIKDQNNDTILLCMDLSAAFDTVDRAILISRQKTKFGIAGTVLKIILSYLTDRVFYVVTDKARSKGRSMKYGVPQGSILGPTLFILYMQDLEMIAREHGLSIHYVYQEMDSSQFPEAE